MAWASDLGSLNQLNVFSHTETKDGGLAAGPGTAVGFVGAGCWVAELAVEFGFCAIVPGAAAPPSLLPVESGAWPTGPKANYWGAILYLPTAIKQQASSRQAATWKNLHSFMIKFDSVQGLTRNEDGG
jgi:hypothetical protein